MTERAPRGRPAPALDRYLAALPAPRRERIDALRACVQAAAPDARETMRYRMPTFELGEAWVCVGNQKHHVSVYFCSEALIAPIRERHPELGYGKGCVRIRDRQPLPLAALARAAARALG